MTLTTELFSNGQRTDESPAGPNASIYRFLDRSARPFFAAVRDLLAELLKNVPAQHRASMLGSFQSGDNHSFNSAFWELHLHEAYRRSGHDVTIHPDVPDSTKRPDFLIQSDHTRFYLEAVCVNVTPGLRAEIRRLNEVHEALDRIQHDYFSVGLAVGSVGPSPLSAKILGRAATHAVARHS
jgi:hypothetical protein